MSDNGIFAVGVVAGFFAGVVFIFGVTWFSVPDTGTRGGLCYGNQTCNEPLRCFKDPAGRGRRCAEPASIQVDCAEAGR